MDSHIPTQGSLELIKFRRNAKPASTSSAHWSNFNTVHFQLYFDTGYVPCSTQHQHQEDNNKNSLVYSKLPRELVLEIMCHATAEDLYFLRQTSRLFFLLYPLVSTLFEAKAMASGDAEGGPRRAQLLADRCPPALGPYPHFSQEVLFSAAHDLSGRDVDLWGKQLRDRLLRDACDDCKVQNTVAATRLISGTVLQRCNSCQFDHAHWRFSDAQLRRKRGRCCIAFEGELRLCPHKTVRLVPPAAQPAHLLAAQESPYPYRSVRLARNNSKQSRAPAEPKMKWVECRECPELLPPGPGQDAPRITSAADGEPAYVSWKVTVCTLAPGQVVTKKLLGEGLKRLQHFSDALCPHASFEDGYLLRPFDWDRCVCFREAATAPEPEENICGAHGCSESNRDSEAPLPLGKHCCACHNREKSVSVGRFMADSEGRENHRVRCHRCETEYSWTLEGDRVMLSATRDLMEDAVVVGSGESGRIGLTAPEHLDSYWPAWVHALDPKTFEGNKFTREIHRCKRRSCISSKGPATTCLDNCTVPVLNARISSSGLIKNEQARG